MRCSEPGVSAVVAIHAPRGRRRWAGVVRPHLRMAFYRVIIKICTDSGGEPYAECDAFLYRKVRCMAEADARTIALRGIESDSSLPFFAAAARHSGAFHF